MKAEYLYRTHQRMQALRCQHVAMETRERVVDDLQIVQKFLCRGIGVLRRHGMACSLAAAEHLERGGQPCIHARQRAAIRLVAAVHIAVGRGIGQGLHLGRDAHQIVRQRQLAAQPMHLAQIVAQRHIGLARQGQLQALGRHKGLPSRSPPIHCPMRRKLWADSF